MPESAISRAPSHRNRQKDVAVLWHRLHVLIEVEPGLC